MRGYFVYMLLCADGRYYVGVTNDVERRFAEHEEGLDAGAWTHGRGPFELVYVQEFQWIQEAIAWEKQLKGWSAKKKKALCEENYEALSEFARCRNATRHDRPRLPSA
jgi:putative endonuclease